MPLSLLPRAHNRPANAVRPAYLRTGVVHGAAGSAYLEQEHTKLVCAVYGPRWSKRMEYSESGQFACDVKYSPTAQHKRRRRGQGDDEKAASLALTQALAPAIRLTQYPKSYIEAFVMVLEDDGGVLPAAMTAVSLALADAQVEMIDLVAATSAHIVTPAPSQPPTILLDCTTAEQNHTSHTAALTLAYLPTTASYPHLQLLGTLPTAPPAPAADSIMEAGEEDEEGGGGWFEALLGAAVGGCEGLVGAMRAALREGMVRKVREAEAKEALDRELVADSVVTKADESAPV